MSWAAREYYAEKDGKFYSFDAITQRNDAVENYGMEKVLSSEIYRYHINCIKIPLDKYSQFIQSL